MAAAPLISADTDPGVHQLVVQRLREMTPAQRAERMVSLTRDTEQLAIAGIRARHPGATEHEVLMRLGVLRNGAELMKAAYGWDADVEGR